MRVINHFDKIKKKSILLKVSSLSLQTQGKASIDKISYRMTFPSQISNAGAVWETFSVEEAQGGEMKREMSVRNNVEEKFR